VEAGLRRWAAGRLALLEVRLGPRRAAGVRTVLEEEDRRSLRALLRGAAAGARPELRAGGLVPTSRLPAPAIEAMSRAPDVPSLVAGLRRLGHPAASTLEGAAATTVPDLLRLEAALDRAFAARALEGARHGGSETLAFVREAVDLANAASALALAAAPGDVDPGWVFVEGGARVDAPLLARAVLAGSREAAASMLAPAFADGPLEVAFGDAAAGPGGWERRALGLRIDAWRRTALTAPLGPAPFLVYTLRLRASVSDLSRLAWAAALGAPPEVALAGPGSRP